MSKGALSLAVAVVLAVTATAAVGLTTERETVEAKCPPSLVDPDRIDDGDTYHDGRFRHPATAPTGVSSYILNYSPWVWFDSAVVAWPMLNRGVTKWGQIGWLEWEGDERATFVQYTPVDMFQGAVTAYFPARSLGVSSEYKVLKRGNAFQFYADGISYGAGAVNWTPDSAQLGGEIKTFSSQMPGGSTSGYSEWFSLSRIELGVDAWYDFGGASFPGINWAFGIQRLSSSQFRIW